MPAAYSYDLPERVVDAVERGSSRRGAAVVFKVSAATVVQWTKRLAETGCFAAAPTGGDFKSKAVEVHKEWLLATVNAEPDLTLAELQARLKATHGLEKSLSCLWRFFARHQITFNKKPNTSPNRIDRTSKWRATSGVKTSHRSTLSIRSSSMKPVSARTWPGYAAVLWKDND
jgi:transposase